MQRICHKSIQLWTRTGIADDTFPFQVAGLLLEKTREIHRLPRLFLRQGLYNLNQFLGDCAHVQRLARPAGYGKQSDPRL